LKLKEISNKASHDEHSDRTSYLENKNIHFHETYDKETSKQIKAKCKLHIWALTTKGAHCHLAQGRSQ
jgi:hypothetical protein